jgi:hypothetical protein
LRSARSKKSRYRRYRPARRSGLSGRKRLVIGKFLSVRSRLPGATDEVMGAARRHWKPSPCTRSSQERQVQENPGQGGRLRSQGQKAQRGRRRRQSSSRDQPVLLLHGAMGAWPLLREQYQIPRSGIV